MEDKLDKDNESYLDGLLDTFGQEPPYETDRRRKATARAKNNNISIDDINIDSLNEEFGLGELEGLDDSFLDDVELEDLAALSKDEQDIITDSIEQTKDNIVSDDSLKEVSESEESENVENMPETGEKPEVETVNSTTDTLSEETPNTGVELGTEVVEGADSVTGAELGTEIGEEIGAELGVEFGTEVGAELGVELGNEIGEEIGTELGIEPDDVPGISVSEADTMGEISLDDADTAITDDPLPIISPLDDIGEPEVLSDKEIKSNKTAKREKNERARRGFFAHIFHKLFANVPLTDEEIAAIPTPEEEESAKKEKEAEAAKKKEEKKVASEEEKKRKAEEAKTKAAEKKAKKEAKYAAKKAAKKEAELKRLRAEALEQPEGKINKVGAIIIFLFFTVAAAVVIVGTNIFSYDISIADATYKFGNHKYTEAYEGIRGLEIKEKDMLLHDKIYTVMFVNKQLNSYNNFFAMGDYSSALDSLIKGLSRYDKYIALARQLGIHTDLDYVRKQIMAELQNIYGVDEREALELMEMTDRQDYSERIYATVSKLDTTAIEAEKEKEELVP